MKPILFLFALWSSANGIGQISEAYFKYNIDVSAIEKTEEVMATTRLLRNSEMVIYFDENNSRVEFKLGNISRTTTVINKKLNEGIIYSSGSMGNIATKRSASDFSPSTSTDKSIRSVVKAHDEYRTILGFRCRKYTLNDGQFTATYWCTDDIKIDPNLNSTFNSDLPGFPLSFYTISKGMRMEYQASDYSFTIYDKNELFSTDVPDGYKLVR